MCLQCFLNGRTSQPIAAVSRLQVAATDSYDFIAILSTYWASDNTGSKEDSELFLNTLSNLGLTGSYF